ncbi:hypothetical protein HMPREF2978_00500 [Corynebacterium sp. HMSC074C01]|uniref:hypothetical protein n=1 Tax=Corynebacterium sp. HMSC074C01 TaxID=1739482 RepID=UPI0008A3A1B1|nr:hypothetical protein [Corynebacterium sp. HMSC074C01]OFP64472.1 hypothetical protein HMPREF2978_00500 [Corynebacterium sp. HMSC074C01]
MSRDDLEAVWRDRYRELEKTLEQVIQQLALASSGPIATQESKFNLQKVVIHKVAGSEQVIGVASGENLEFAFDFLRDGELVKSVDFQRANSIPLSFGKSAKANECIVKVKTYKPELQGQVREKRVAI